ncbi:hypothetical protein HYC85_015368 [Camellia sinensis]|uniref:Major facilitator superfamily (MFS) profile domain-containing protein n=1 Tax=Camellia sinensis TaxID=4442 RepID=A0A7J7GWX5_CAMSI|nr:hypothetical protein HYC85_015368 [Camellia sinensis]
MANPDHTNPDRPNFPLSVDSEHKATVLRLFTVAQPHMRAFHITWISYFCSFISTFAATPLLPIIRDNLNLTATEIGNTGIASISGAVFARVVMGSACDMFVPRLAFSALLLLVSPAVYCFSIINSAASFLVVRFLWPPSSPPYDAPKFEDIMIGLQIVPAVAALIKAWNAIACLLLSSYTPNSVRHDDLSCTTNAVSAGWGNFGGGATQIIMAYVFSIILDMGAVRFTARRIAFFIPALMQTTSAFSIFFLAQDLPDGNFTDLKKSGEKHRDEISRVFRNAVTNYRVWILALTYEYCFGVELAVDNIIAQYFYDRFNVNLHTAGIIAASFGLANIFSRPTGGIISDAMAKRFGMRGRLWALWAVQSLGGLLCVVLGRVGSLGASIAVLVAFSFCVQASCGLTFGIVPFISRR